MLQSLHDDSFVRMSRTQSLYSFLFLVETKSGCMTRSKKKHVDFEFEKVEFFLKSLTFVMQPIILTSKIRGKQYDSKSMSVKLVIAWPLSVNGMPVFLA